MPSDVAVLKQLIRDYVEGRIPFMTFHNSFIERFVRLPDSALDEDDRWQWNRAYELVLSSTPDPVTPQDQAGGLIGEDGLKARLGALPWL